MHGAELRRVQEGIWELHQHLTNQETATTHMGDPSERADFSSLMFPHRAPARASTCSTQSCGKSPPPPRPSRYSMRKPFCVASIVQVMSLPLRLITCPTEAYTSMVFTPPKVPCLVSVAPGSRTPRPRSSCYRATLGILLVSCRLMFLPVRYSGQHLTGLRCR